MSIKVPAGACDTHMHFYDRNVPPAPGTPMPGHFDVAMYRALQKRLGLERVVVVQPNAYRHARWRWWAKRRPKPSSIA